MNQNPSLDFNQIKNPFAKSPRISTSYETQLKNPNSETSDLSTLVANNVEDYLEPNSLNFDNFDSVDIQNNSEITEDIRDLGQNSSNPVKVTFKGKIPEGAKQIQIRIPNNLANKLVQAAQTRSSRRLQNQPPEVSLENFNSPSSAKRKRANRESDVKILNRTHSVGNLEDHYDDVSQIPNKTNSEPLLFGESSDFEDSINFPSAPTYEELGRLLNKSGAQNSASLLENKQLIVTKAIVHNEPYPHSTVVVDTLRTVTTNFTQVQTHKNTSLVSMAEVNPFQLGVGNALQFEKFNGKFGANVKTYVDRFKNIANCAKLNDQQKKMLLILNLEEDSLKWYKYYEASKKAANEFENLTFDQLVTDLIEAFQHINNIAEIALSQAEQQVGQSAESYVYDVLHLISQVYPELPEAAKIKMIVKGLRNNLKQSVLIADPKTIKELIQKLKVIENAMIQSGQHEVYKSTNPTNLLAVLDANEPVKTELESLNKNIAKLIEDNQHNRTQLGHNSYRNNQFRSGVPNQNNRFNFRNQNWRPNFSRPSMSQNYQQFRQNYIPQSRPLMNAFQNRDAMGRLLCFHCNSPTHLAAMCSRRQVDRNLGFGYGRNFNRNQQSGN